MSLSFQLLGHAGVKIITPEFRMVIDPWFGYPVNLGNLVAYPPISVPTQAEIDSIQLIHFSHRHRDHFCARSLERFDRSVPVLISDYKDKSFEQQIRRLGFQNILCVTEEPLAFGPFLFRSYQMQPYDDSGDSALLVSYEGQNVFLNNDCYLSEERYAGIAKSVGKINYGFLGYQVITPFPTCYELGTTPQAQTLAESKEDSYEHLLMLDRYFQFDMIFPYANGLRLRRPESLVHNRAFNPLPEVAMIPQLAGRIYLLEPGDHWSPRQVQTDLRFPYDSDSVIRLLEKTALSERPKSPQITNEIHLAFFLSYLIRQDRIPNHHLKIGVRLQDESSVSCLIYFEGKIERCQVENLEDCELTITYPLYAINAVITRQALLSDIYYGFLFSVEFHGANFSRGHLVHRWY